MKKTAEISLNTACKKKDERFEYIRAIAIVAVVAIHTINSAIVLLVFEAAFFWRKLFFSQKSINIYQNIVLSGY